MKRIVIANPSAGSAGHDELRAAVANVAADHQYFCASADEAEQIAHRAAQEGCACIAVAGGDGTLNAVVNGIVGSDCAIGILPAGTGNDFARTIELPNDLAECAAILDAGKTKRVDLVRVCCDSVRHFVNVSAGGFSGLVNEKLTTELKKSWGPLAYLRSAAEAYADLHAFSTTVTFDGASPITSELYNVVVANGRYVAGGIAIAPEALVDDGLLDVVLIPKLPNSSIALVAAQMMLGKHLGNGAVEFRQAAKVRIESHPGMWFNVDGELISNEPMTFDVLPSAVRFYVP